MHHKTLERKARGHEIIGYQIGVEMVFPGFRAGRLGEVSAKVDQPITPR
jgi:hypothetical protein